MNKKILSIFISFLIIFSLSVCTYAEQENDEPAVYVPYFTMNNNDKNPFVAQYEADMTVSDSPVSESELTEVTSEVSNEEISEPAVPDDDFVPEYNVEEYDGIDDGEVMLFAAPVEEEISEEFVAADGARSMNPAGEAPVKERKLFSVGRIVAALVFGFLIAFISVKIVASKLKSVKSSDNANAYEKEDGEFLTHSADRFLYSDVSKTMKPDSQQKKK